MTNDQKAIEAAARAMCEAEGYAFYPEDNPIDGHYGKLATAACRAYLEALEPTAAQVTAGAKVLRDDGYSGDCYRAARLVFAAMCAARPQIEGE